MRKKLFIALVVLVAAGAAYWAWGRDRGDGVGYRFVAVERGDLQSVVSSTGTLEAVTTVQVGTQVSGIVSEIYADFNQEVTKGQMIARLDPTLLETAVREAETGLARSRAELRAAQVDHERNQKLHAQQIVAASQLDVAVERLEVARASTAATEFALARARQNLAYATVYAPISGTVIARSVDVGQTVAASLSAPELFLIAADLSRMQILAAVDESDIGQVREGQEVRFTVQAYPQERFVGVVRQVRLQPATVENVVNYTAVVDVDNRDRKLLPGMTATVEFLIDSASDVLMVSNAALRFRPTEEMLAQLRQGEGAPERRSRDGASERGPRTNGERSRSQSDVARLWVLGADGKPAVRPVKVGISDGQMTQIAGDGVAAGTQVIVGVTAGEQAASTSPFQSAGAPGGGRRGMGF